MHEDTLTSFPVLRSALAQTKVRDLKSLQPTEEDNVGPYQRENEAREGRREGVFDARMTLGTPRAAEPADAHPQARVVSLQARPSLGPLDEVLTSSEVFH